MRWFPQTGRDSVVQFPFSRVRTWRAIANELESGERITLPETSTGAIQWNLRYNDLSDAEAGALIQFFEECGGGQKVFSFMDPTANLFAWSEDLSQPDWEAPQLILTAGAADPFGTQRAVTVSNVTQADLKVLQTVGVPGSQMACLSAWVRQASQGTVSLKRDDVNRSFATGPKWKRVELGVRGPVEGLQSTFSLGVRAGQTVDVFGPQLEGQPSASTYRQSKAPRGIYTETRFAGDELVITSDGPGRSSCDLVLISRII